MQPDSTAAQITAFGTPEVLEIVTSPAPEPGPGQARIRVEASSVQFTDTLIRRGIYPDLKERPPLTVGYDVVGVVDAVGDGVSEVAPGDRVADLCTIGGNAQFVNRPAQGLVPVPSTVDAAQAATLVLSWLSAQQAVFRMGRLKAGERLLVTGANGAVGQAAVTLGLQAGAEVFATAGEAHHAALSALGAHPLPRDGWADEARGRMDVVLDGIANHGFGPAHRALARGGRLVAIGMSALAGRGMAPMVSALVGFGLRAMLPNGRSSMFYSIAAYRRKHPEAFREDLGALFDKLERHEIEPVVAERIPFTEVPEAHRRLEAGGLTGKLVLDPWA